jgi:hypothetical protein
MELEYEHSQADLEAWWRYYSRRTLAYKLNYWALAVLAAGGGLWIAVQFDVDLFGTVALVALGFLLGWGAAVVSARVWLRDLATAASRSPAAKETFGSHRLWLTEEGVTERGPAATHSHTWRAVEALWDTADHFFLTVGGGQAYVIPKRAFHSPSADAEFRALVASRLAEERRRRTSA